MMSLKVSTPVWSVGSDDNYSAHSLIISSTKNYDQFTIDSVNRPVYPKHVKELVEAIRAKNLLREFPIVVDVNLKVTDGQHRLLAAKELGVPLFFIVSGTMTIKDVAAANKNQEGWKADDFLHYWKSSGSPHYIALQEFKNTYPFLSVSICRFLLSGNMQRADSLFNDGQFTINYPELAEKVGQCLIDFSKHTKLHTRFQFVNAVNSMVAHPQYNHRRMMQKLDYMSGHLHRCVDAAEYLAMLSEIYNFKVKEDEKVKFTPINRGRNGGKKS